MDKNLNSAPGAGEPSTPTPCPFCGGAAYATRTVNGTQMFLVGCASCGVEMKAAWYRGEERPTKDILSLWNQRFLPRPASPEAGARPEPPTTDVESLYLRIQNYLNNGGFFNPEAMDHAKVRDLLLDLKGYLSAAYQHEIYGSAPSTEAGTREGRKNYTE